MTPLGREIADILLAVNRPYGKSDYIPCICWGRNANFAKSFEVGGRLHIWGRIQSREYMKKLDEENVEKTEEYEEVEEYTEDSSTTSSSSSSSSSEYSEKTKQVSRGASHTK